MSEFFSADVLRRAAEHPHAPRRLQRVADAVRDGKFTWDEVATGQSAHPLAATLLTPKARETLWPLLDQVAAEPEPEPERPVRPVADEDDYEEFGYLEDVDEPQGRGFGARQGRNP